MNGAPCQAALPRLLVLLETMFAYSRLSPDEEGIYTYDIPSLEGGDIILSTSPAKRSGVIRTVTGSEYSHAMLYTNKTIVHAEGAGVYTINPQRILFSKGQSVVLRLRKPHDCNLKKVCSFAFGQAGAPYTVPEAVLAVAMQNSGQRALSSAQYCSRLIAQAFESAGVQLVSNGDFCVPGQFLHCSLLEIVEDAVRLANANELELSQTPDTLQIHREHTVAWLEPVRALAKRCRGIPLVTIQDAFEFVRTNPQHDDDVLGFLEKSGYLEDAALDRQVSPHRYDLSMFRSRLAQFPDSIQAALEDDLRIVPDLMKNARSAFIMFNTIALKVHQRLALMHWQRLTALRDRLEIIRVLCAEFGEKRCEEEAQRLLNDLEDFLGSRGSVG